MPTRSPRCAARRDRDPRPAVPSGGIQRGRLPLVQRGIPCGDLVQSSSRAASGNLSAGSRVTSYPAAPGQGSVANRPNSHAWALGPDLWARSAARFSRAEKLAMGWPLEAQIGPDSGTASSPSFPAVEFGHVVGVAGRKQWFRRARYSRASRGHEGAVFDLFILRLDERAGPKVLWRVRNTPGRLVSRMRVRRTRPAHASAGSCGSSLQPGEIPAVSPAASAAATGSDTRGRPSAAS